MARVLVLGAVGRLVDNPCPGVQHAVEGDASSPRERVLLGSAGAAGRVCRLDNIKGVARGIDKGGAPGILSLVILVLDRAVQDDAVIEAGV